MLEASVLVWIKSTRGEGNREPAGHKSPWHNLTFICLMLGKIYTVCTLQTVNTTIWRNGRMLYGGGLHQLCCCCCFLKLQIWAFLVLLCSVTATFKLAWKLVLLLFIFPSFFKCLVKFIDVQVYYGFTQFNMECVEKFNFGHLYILIKLN